MITVIALITAVVAAVIMSVVVSVKERKKDAKRLQLQDEINEYMIMINTTHDMHDMPWIMALKASYLHAASDLGMDTSRLITEIDTAINEQFKIITDEMVRSGRK